MAPIVYSNGYFRRTAVGALPSTSTNPNATWEFLSDVFLSIQENTILQTNVIDALNSLIDGQSPATYLENINALFKNLAQAITTFPSTPFATARIFLQNSEGVIRASNATSELGKTENGRTEVIVAQTTVDTLASNVRFSSTTNSLNYYIASGLASYDSNSIYPAYFLRLAVTLV